VPGGVGEQRLQDGAVHRLARFADGGEGDGDRPGEAAGVLAFGLDEVVLGEGLEEGAGRLFDVEGVAVALIPAEVVLA
jgi:hypothetical protein